MKPMCGNPWIPGLGPKQFEPILKLRLRSTRITAVAGTGRPIDFKRSKLNFHRCSFLVPPKDSDFGHPTSWSKNTDTKSFNR